MLWLNHTAQNYIIFSDHLYDIFVKDIFMRFRDKKCALRVDVHLAPWLRVLASPEVDSLEAAWLTAWTPDIPGMEITFLEKSDEFTIPSSLPTAAVGNNPEGTWGRYRVPKKRVMFGWVHKFKASHIQCFLQCALHTSATCPLELKGHFLWYLSTNLRENFSTFALRFVLWLGT